MKINSTNYSTQILKQNTENHKKSKAPAFCGNPLVGLASFIENNGFMGEFLTIDTTGMGIPRAGQGYLRNHKELGHLNYKAGHEEVTRELLSGPAFFFVPLLTTIAAALVGGKSAKVPRKTLAQFQKLMQKTDVNLKNAAQTKKNFTKTVIKQVFGDYEHEPELVERLSKLMDRNFNEKFSVKDKFLNIFRKKDKKVDTRARLREEAESILTKLNKANEKLLDNTGCMKIGEVVEKGEVKPVLVDVKSFFEDAKNYLDDFTSKAATTTKNKKSFTDSFHKNATALRATAEVSAIAALCAFLTYIPKLYQTGKDFPGKDGLVANNQQNTTTSDKKTKEAV